jgi:arsenate reductase
MAEALARVILPEGTKVQSAGSDPSSVHPMAVQVLAEMGIDMSGQRSKSVDSVEREGIDTVVTLCAEEVCPVFLGQARRIHWGLPDPDRAGIGDEEKLQRFRDTRDRLEKLIRLLGPDAAV